MRSWTSRLYCGADSTVPMSDTTALDEPGVGPTAGRRTGLLVPLIVAAGLGLVGLFVWAPVPPGVWHDDGAYLLLGKSLADGEGLRYSQVPGAPPGAKFPPLYPLFLALLWRVAPEAVGQGPLGSLFNVLFLASSGGLFVAYLRSLKFSWRSSVAAAVLLWLLPDLWRLALVPLSEPLFLVTLVAALWTGSRLEAQPTWRRVAEFLAAFAVAYHTRTMGIAIGIAVPLALLMRGRRAWAFRSAASAGIIIAPWMFWSGRAAAAIPAPLRDTLGPYAGWLASQAGGEGGSFGVLVASALALAGPNRWSLSSRHPGLGSRLGGGRRGRRTDPRGAPSLRPDVDADSHGRSPHGDALVVALSGTPTDDAAHPCPGDGHGGRVQARVGKADSRDAGRWRVAGSRYLRGRGHGPWLDGRVGFSECDRSRRRASCGVPPSEGAHACPGRAGCGGARPSQRGGRSPRAVGRTGPSHRPPCRTQCPFSAGWGTAPSGVLRRSNSRSGPLLESSMSFWSTPGWFIRRRWTSWMRAAPVRSSFRRPGLAVCWCGWTGTMLAGPLSCRGRNPAAPHRACLGLPLDLALLRGVDLFPLAATQ